jgi:hypothetical protein
MSRQFANVSISPWANPYNGAVGTGHNYYTSAVAKPVFRRLAVPPTKFSYPGVQQVIDDSDDEEAGMILHSVV